MNRERKQPGAGGLAGELGRIADLLTRWQAALQATLWAAVVVGVLFLCTWNNAMARVLNPFPARSPSLLTQVMADQAPEIHVLAPDGKTLLTPGVAPVISFRVSDDYGLAEVFIERVEAAAADAAGSEAPPTGERVASWTPEAGAAFEQQWSDAACRPEPGKTAAFQIVAIDQAPEPHRTVSAPIVFHTADAVDRRGPAAERAVLLEQRILRTVSRVVEGLAQAEDHRRVSDLVALLDALVKHQDHIVTTARAIAGQPVTVPDSLFEAQDGLSGDVAEFIKICRREADALAANDPDFASVIRQVASGCEDRKVMHDMSQAAEYLEQNQAGEALPYAGRALRSLQDLRKLLQGPLENVFTSWRSTVS